MSTKKKKDISEMYGDVNTTQKEPFRDLISDLNMGVGYRLLKAYGEDLYGYNDIEKEGWVKY